MYICDVILVSYQLYKLTQFNNSSSKIPLLSVVPAAWHWLSPVHIHNRLNFVRVFSHSCYMGPVGREQ